MGGLGRRAVFLDRDGTLNVRPPVHDYVTSEDDFVWVPRAVDGLVRLARAGYVLTVVSNQRGVARGLVSPAVLARIEGRIQNDLLEHGAAIESFRYCIHDVDERCLCRKPKPGMILDLAAELGIDLVNSWLIGDAVSDIEAGKAAGCKTALITGTAARNDADIVAASLADASALIVEQDDQPRRAALWDSNSSTRA